MHDTPLGLYIHVPFCTVKCSYCDFNSYAGIEDMQTEWEAAALTELSLWVPRLQGREVSTVFIGGGTPSLLPGESIERILDTIRSSVSLSADAEITLEANPESVQPERLQTYRAAGVNRISMGVQSLDSDELYFLDRIHSADRPTLIATFVGEIKLAAVDDQQQTQQVSREHQYKQDLRRAQIQVHEVAGLRRSIGGSPIRLC